MRTHVRKLKKEKEARRQRERRDRNYTESLSHAGMFVVAGIIAAIVSFVATGSGHPLQGKILFWGGIASAVIGSAGILLVRSRHGHTR